MNRLRIPSRRRQGQVTIEFAFAVATFFLIIIGIVVFGQIMSYQATLQHAAREGARNAAVCVSDAEVDAIVRKQAAHLPDVNDPSKFQVFIEPPENDPARVRGNDVTVFIKHTFNVAVPIPVIFQNPRTLVAKYTMRIECGPGGGDGGDGGDDHAGDDDHGGGDDHGGDDDHGNDGGDQGGDE